MTIADLTPPLKCFRCIKNAADLKQPDRPYLPAQPLPEIIQDAPAAVTVCEGEALCATHLARLIGA